MYQIRILENANDDLLKIDKQIVRRIAKKIRWLAKNIEVIKPETLTGDFSGLFKLRRGDYRVIYEINRQQEIIIIHFVGHRREIYKKK